MAQGLNRRDAIRLALGMGDRIAMEREQRSAIEIVRGPSPAIEDSPAEPPTSLLARIRARLGALRRPSR